MLVVTDRLTIGQLTFILRVIIQILAYGGAFLLGLIILGHSPTVAVVETHDVINRTVSKSTATSTSLRWIRSRFFGKKKNDGYTSKLLLFAILLSLCYGLFVALGDVGFIGFETCDVPGKPSQDFPASVKSFEDAERLANERMLNGTLAKDVNSYRCDASEDTILPITNASVRMCTAWRNSTYGDPSSFRQLNLTDTDTLMPRRMQRWNSTINDIFDLNTYFIGSTGAPFPQATIEDGLAIIPHDTGVTTLLGVPNLPRFSKVTIPKTMAIEAEVGCLPIGMFGSRVASSFQPETYEYLVIDSVYQSKRGAAYAGPKVLQPVLEKYADQTREAVRGAFNASDIVEGGESIRSFNTSSNPVTWHTVASSWPFPDVPSRSSSDQSQIKRDIMGNCTADVLSTVKAPTPPQAGNRILAQPPEACGFYQLSGSFVVRGGILQGYTNYICAAATQINMVSASVAIDGEGKISHTTSKLPSDLFLTTADYYDVTNAGVGPRSGPYIVDPIVRFTLADNPNGETEHYIYQESPFSIVAYSLTQGSGSMGGVVRSIGGAMVTVDSSREEVLGIINATYFGAGDIRTNATVITRWAGSIGASYLQGSLAFNPWSALDKPPFEVQSTGGKPAICYRPQYAAAFAPLALSALLVMVWAGLLIFGGRFKDTKKLEKIYGGLSPAIVSPYPVKPDRDEVLAWKQGPHPHLTPVAPGVPRVGGESEYLLTQLNSPAPEFPTPEHESK